MQLVFDLLHRVRYIGIIRRFIITKHEQVQFTKIYIFFTQCSCRNGQFTVFLLTIHDVYLHLLITTLSVVVLPLFVLYGSLTPENEKPGDDFVTMS